MKRPSAEAEQELNKLKMFTFEHNKLEDLKLEGNFIGVSIEIAGDYDAPEFAISRISKRGNATLFTDWTTEESNDQKKIKFDVWQRVPEGALPIMVQSNVNYMSYVDLCFFAGNEAIPENYGDDVVTKPRPDSTPVDLGWTMPGRFLDMLLDALADLDNIVLSSTAQHALIYGPKISLALSNSAE